MAALVVGITMRGHLLIFVDPPSILLATLVPMLMMVVTYGRRSADLARAVGAWLMGRDSGATDPAAHRAVAVMARDYGQYAVVNGCICALIGHVMMLQNMSDPSAIGPAMAVALLTTFYGSVIANVFTIPIASKLKQRSKQEATKMNIIVAGVLGIVAGENPRVIREKLDSFLPPKDRMVEDKKE